MSDSDAPVAETGRQAPGEAATHYLRDLDAVLVTASDRCVVASGLGEVRIVDRVDGDAVSEVWGALASPIASEELAARLAAAPAGVRSLFDDLLSRGLVVRGSIDELRQRRSKADRPTRPRPCGHLVLGVSGGVQAATVIVYLQRLTAHFAETVDVILTEAAERFVPARALSTAGARVWRDLWETDPEVEVAHIHLARLADLVLVLPATAHTISRLAQAACSDLLSLTVAATAAPVVVVPGMNTAMWRHPGVQRNLERLRRDGIFVVEPALGYEVADREALAIDVGAVGLDPFSPGMLKTLEALLPAGAKP